MKKNYVLLCLISFLNIYHITFSLEQQVTDLYNTAKNFELQGDITEAKKSYKQAINIKLPFTVAAASAEALQNRAKIRLEYLENIKPILNQAEDLMNKHEFNEAFKKLQEIPETKRNIQEVKDFAQQIRTEQTKWSNSQIISAKNLARNNKYQAAYRILDELINQNSLNAIKVKEKLQQEQQTTATRQIKDLLEQAEDLANTGNYTQSYQILNKLETQGSHEAIEIKKRIKELEAADGAIKYAKERANREDYSRAFKALEVFVNKGFAKAISAKTEIEKQKRAKEQGEVVRNAGQKLIAGITEARRLIAENKYDEAINKLDMLPAREEVANLKRDAIRSRNEWQQQFVHTTEEKRKTALAEAQRLMRDGQYNEALTALAIFPPEEREVVELRKKIEQYKQFEHEIARAEQLARDNNYVAAYDILTQLKNEGSRDANSIDQKLIKDQIRLAKTFATRNDYDAAYAIANVLKAKRPGNEIEIEKTIQARQEANRQREEARLRRRRTAETAAEVSQEQERLQAEEARQREIQQEQERRRQQEEQRQAQEKQRLTQEEARRRIPAKPLDLKNTFINLSNILKTLANSIITAPSTSSEPKPPAKFKPLQSLARKPTPPGRRPPLRPYRP